jgi:hypothetical protein
MNQTDTKFKIEGSSKIIKPYDKQDNSEVSSFTLWCDRCSVTDYVPASTFKFFPYLDTNTPKLGPSFHLSASFQALSSGFCLALANLGPFQVSRDLS